MKVMMMAMMKKNKTKMIEHDKGCPGRLATAAILTPSTTPKKKEIIMTALMKMINLMRMVIQCNAKQCKGWLAIAKLKPLSLFISLFLMLKKACDNVKIEK